MNNLRAVVWSEFASAMVSVVVKSEDCLNKKDLARMAAEWADLLMDEFDRRFPREEQS